MGTTRGRWTLAALLAVCAGPVQAVQPIPLMAGTYCGPGDARIVIDVARDEVTIDGMVCGAPVIAADHLQSDLCGAKSGAGTQNFDFSVVGPDFFHGGAWYRRCGDVPAPAG